MGLAIMEENNNDHLIASFTLEALCFISQRNTMIL